MKKLICVFIIPLFFLFAGNSYASTLEETFKKRIDFEPGGYLELNNSNGSIDVQAWDRNEIEIIAYKQVRASGREEARELMDRLEIKISERDDKIFIETLMPRQRGSGGGFFDWMFGGNKYSYSVSYELRVPYEIDMNIGTTNGEVEVKKIQGRMRLHSTNGKITGKDISGLAKCKTTNGSIRMEFNRIPDGDELTFRTTNGSIRVYLPEEFSGYVDLQTTNGNVDTDFRLSEARKYKKKRLTGTIGDGDCDLTCKTTNGSIYLYRND